MATDMKTTKRGCIWRGCALTLSALLIVFIEVNLVTSLALPPPDDLYRPIVKDGRYQIPWATWPKPSLNKFFKFISSRKFTKTPSTEELDVFLPIIPLNQDSLKSIPENGLRITWLGHASLLVQFDNISILTDPIFSERASPFSFMGPKRYRSAPGSVNELPKIDAVVISHSHYDHLDYESVKSLNDRFGAELHWFVPMGLKQWMNSSGCESVFEMTWWDELHLPPHPQTKIAFTPSQHWSKRTLSDDNTVLWGSYSIIGPRHKFFFAGDTGYCEAFKQIGNKYGPFDLAAIPIGAYSPREFMRRQHVDPAEAVKIHKDVKANRSLGVHWGTFTLSNEHYKEPPLKLAEVAKENLLETDEFFVLTHGESYLVVPNEHD